MATTTTETEEFDEELLEKRLGTDQFTSRQWRILLCICFTYVTVIPNRAFIASISTSLKEDTSITFTNTTYGTLAVIAGAAYAFGKLFDGIVIDGRLCFKGWMNEIRAMLLFQLISCIFVFLFSFADSLTWMVIFAVPNAIVQAGTWPALAKLIFEIYEPAQFGRVFAMMGLSSKIGSVLSKLYIGGIILWLDDWRWAVRLVSVIGVIGLIFFFIITCTNLTGKEINESDQVWFAFPYYSKLKEFFKINNNDQMLVENQSSDKNEINTEQQQSNKNDLMSKSRVDFKTKRAITTNKQLKYLNPRKLDKPEPELKEEKELRKEVLQEITEDIDEEPAGHKYKRLIINRRFFLMGMSIMCLTMMVGLEGFADLLIDDILLVSNNGIVTLVAACLPAGIAVALIISHIYVRKKHPSMKKIATFVNISLIITFLLSIALTLWVWVIYWSGCFNEGFCLATIGILFFCFGLLIAYPYYVPSGVFSLRYGGKDSGTVSALLDLFGFIPAAGFSYGGSALSEEKYGWGYVWLFLYIPICFFVIFFYSSFNRYNIITEKKQESLMKRIEEQIDTLVKGYSLHKKDIEMQNSVPI